MTLVRKWPSFGDSLLCSVGQEESQEVNITSDGNPSQEEDIIEKHGIVLHDKVITSPKALPEKSALLGLQVKLPPAPPTVNELLCFVKKQSWGAS